MKAVITLGTALILTILVGATATAQQSSSAAQTVTFGVHRFIQNNSGAPATTPKVFASESGVFISQIDYLNNQPRKITVGKGSSLNHSAAAVSRLQVAGSSVSGATVSSLTPISDVRQFSFSRDRESSKDEPIFITITE